MQIEAKGKSKTRPEYEMISDNIKPRTKHREHVEERHTHLQPKTHTLNNNSSMNRHENTKPAIPSPFLISFHRGEAVEKSHW